jgi:hypothetical protein
MHRFHLQGFSVESEIALPCDSLSQSPFSQAQETSLSVRRSSLQDVPCLVRKIRKQPSYDVGNGVLIEPNHLLMHINLEGTVISVDVEDNYLEWAALWVMSKGLSVCTAFQGGLPLHAAGVEIEDHYIGIMAPSGTGKSTLLWTLLQQGCRFGNDDMIPLHIESNRVVAVPSSASYPKIGRALLQKHGPQATPFRRVQADEEEFWMLIERKSRVKTARPLKALFLLQPDSHMELHQEVIIDRLPEDVLIPLLLENMHALWLIHRQLDKNTLLSQCAVIARTTPVHVLRYRKCFEVLPNLATAIRQSLSRAVVAI